MRAHLYRFAYRLQCAKRAGALAVAIAVAGIAWNVAGEPPRIVVTAQGQEYVQQRGFWIQIALLVISALVSYALAPKPPKPKPAALEDFDIPQSKEGQPFCWIFGECEVPDATVGYWGNLSSAPIKGKGGKK